MNHDITSVHDNVAASATGTATNALHRAGDQASAFAQRSSDALHHGADALHRRSGELQSRARHYSEETTAYIHREPAKSMLIAAAAGAALMALMTLVSRARSAP